MMFLRTVTAKLLVFLLYLRNYIVTSYNFQQIVSKFQNVQSYGCGKMVGGSEERIVYNS